MSPRDLKRPVARVPAGWLTTRQWAKKWKLSEPRTFQLLAEGIRIKRVRRQYFRIVAGRRTMPVPHYRAA